MHPHRVHAIRSAWDDYEMGHCTRHQAEAVENIMLADQRREREQLADTTIIVDCARCGALIDVQALAYRGANRHACVDCLAGGTTGWPRVPVDEDDERGGRR